MPVINSPFTPGAVGNSVTGPCSAWELACADFPEGTTPEIQAMAAMAATEALWMRTKQQFGLCTITLRPCRKDCFPSWPWVPLQGWNNLSGATWPWPQPALVGGNWINIACGQCSSGCSCSVVHEVRLPYPVNSVVEVKVDGVVLPPSAYRVDNFNLLVRVDGGEWPRCNDLNLDDTEVGTWSVTANYGDDVPQLGKLAAGQLAVEIAKRCVGAGGCVLPAGTVQQITRQGVTKVFFDSDQAFAQGMLGLYWADMFVKTYNPSGTGTASIFDIDGPRHRRVGTS